MMKKKNNKYNNITTTTTTTACTTRGRTQNLVPHISEYGLFVLIISGKKSHESAAQDDTDND